MTKNCVILGAPRSGTSMTAGCVATGEFFMGNEPLDVYEANPLGFFEDRKINQINDRILLLTQAGIFWRSKHAISIMGRLRGLNNQWTNRLSTGTPIRANDELLRDIFHATEKSPFCLKDPRFCYTLPVWQPYLKNTVIVCVFRNPSENAQSIVQFAQGKLAKKERVNTLAKAYRLIAALYSHALENSQHSSNWLFLHYHQVLDKSGISLLEEKLETRLDSTFPDESLYRNRPAGEIPNENLEIYARLCTLAGYRDDDFS